MVIGGMFSALLLCDCAFCVSLFPRLAYLKIVLSVIGYFYRNENFRSEKMKFRTSHPGSSRDVAATTIGLFSRQD